MANVKTKKRIIYLDYLRAIAILGVLLNHISANWVGAETLNSFIALFYNSLGKVAVPIFLMLTGILLLNNKLPIKDFIKRRYPRVIIPFLFWIGLFIVYRLFVLEPSVLSENPIKSAIVWFLTNRWYVCMVLGVYLIIPIFASFIKGTKLEGVKYFLIIWFITTTICTLSHIFGFSLDYLDLAIFSGPIGFIMLGYYLHNKEINMSPKKIVIISLVALILLTLIKTVMSYYDLSLVHSFKYYIFTNKSHLENDIITIIQVAAFFLIIKYLPMVKSGVCEKITKFCNKEKMLSLIISISQASYGIYLCHYFITLTVVKIMEMHNIGFSGIPSVIVVPIATICVLLLSHGMIMILNKVPIINKFAGYH